MTPKKLSIGLSGVLLCALAFFGLAERGHAAYNDVSLTTDAVIRVTVSGTTVDLTVSGGTATVESIAVGSDNFTVTLKDLSTLTIASANRYDINTDNSAVVTSETCSSTESKMTLASTNAAATQTVVVTPTLDVCQASGGGGGGGSSSSGGGGGSAPTKKTETKTPNTGAMPVPPIVPAPGSGAGGSNVIISTLLFGIVSDEVRTLQAILNRDSGTKVAEAGPGSPGNETAYFGLLTRAAVQKFQTKHDIALPTDPGYGIVGPKTRAQLEIMAGGASSAPPAQSSSVAQTIADLLKQVQALQAQLQLLKQQ